LFLSGFTHQLKTVASKRIAMSFLGSSPTVGRPTRRIEKSWRAAR
jgi:hypothetical protein